MEKLHGTPSTPNNPFLDFNSFLTADSDLSAVAQCSSFLDISEFRVFQLAHLEWYGFSMSDRKMERLFHNYLEREQVPFWVRQFSRKVLILAGEGRLSPYLFDIPRPVVDEDDRTRGQWYLIVLTIVLVTFCIFISGYPSF